MPELARWILVVARRTDDALRQFLADRGLDRKSALSRFVEQAEHARVLELTAEQAKRQNRGQSQAMIAQAVDEALEWARRA